MTFLFLKRTYLHIIGPNKQGYTARQLKGFDSNLSVTTTIHSSFVYYHFVLAIFNVIICPN